MKHFRQITYYMMTFDFKVYRRMLFCFLVMSALCLDLHATDNSNIQSPTIKVTWTPQFDKDSLVLLITNFGSHSIKVDPRLQPSTTSFDYDASDIFYIFVHFETKPHEFVINGINYSGQPPALVEVSPGDTKVMKFDTPKFFDEFAKNGDPFKLCLYYNNKLFQSSIFNKIDGLWKENK